MSDWQESEDAEMAAFKLLQDHFIGNQLLLAGTVQQTADIAGGLLPVNWRPSNNSEPLDAAAVTLLYAAGPQITGLVRQQWSTIGVAPPATFWKTTPATAPTSYQLTGLGAALPPVSV